MRAAALSLAFATALVAADSLPKPPCGGDVFPAYADTDSPPIVQIWDRAEWTPPACVGWSASGGTTLVVTAACFRFAGGAEGLRRRIGAVSEMKGLLYWSTTNRQWQPLILASAAVEDGSGARPRKDFSVDEVAPGRTLYLEQEDILLGKAGYRMRILEARPDRLVFSTENSTTIRYLGLPLAQPGEIQSICFLDRDAKDVWRYYAIARTGKAASLLTAGHGASLINRAVAWFRYLAGIPADREPPAAK